MFTLISVRPIWEDQVGRIQKMNLLSIISYSVSLVSLSPKGLPEDPGWHLSLWEESSLCAQTAIFRNLPNHRSATVTRSPVSPQGLLYISFCPYWLSSDIWDKDKHFIECWTVLVNLVKQTTIVLRILFHVKLCIRDGPKMKLHKIWKMEEK